MSPNDHNNRARDSGDGSPLDALTPDDLERVYDDESVLYWEVENPHEWIYAEHPTEVNP